MKYITDIDEQLPPPPYRLGIDESRFESHHLLLDADRPVLQKLVNRHLNQPLWQAAGMGTGAIEGALEETEGAQIPFGKANRRTREGLDADVPVRFVVPIDSHFVRLTFARYWRVDSASLSGEGSSAYTECLLSFIVRRDVVDELSETMRFLGVVYIDDREFAGQLQDPHALPIMLGREAFGLPKGPGQIFYCPDPGQVRDPRKALLQIWDRDAGSPPAMYLTLKDAIAIDGGPDLPVPPCDLPMPTPASRPEARERLRRFEAIATELGIPRPEFEDRFARRPGLPRHAWVALLEPDRDGVGAEAIVWDDLFLYTRIVGLKQFPDPTRFPDAPSPDPSQDMHVCYRAVVESTLEHEDGEEPSWFSMSPGHTVRFPTGILRVDLLKAFGIVEKAPGSRTADMIEGQYLWGNLFFGNPARVVVWEP